MQTKNDSKNNLDEIMKANRQGLEACKIVLSVLDAVSVTGYSQAKDLCLSFSFIKSLKQAYTDSLKEGTNDAKTQESK